MQSLIAGAATSLWTTKASSTPNAQLRRLSSLTASVARFWGFDDENPNADQVNRTEAELKRLGKKYEFYRYDGAGHAFFNTARVSYRPEQAADGWAKVFKFLQTNLAE
jgi:carboxymethylenebutenolidase